MSLSAGTRLGPYEIQSVIGAGGMGEVYRARDTKLDRDVAVKVLPELFVADPERVARFQREAKTLAALNHPNIAHIYGLEETHGIRALVMELVEGPTVADRIGLGRIPLDETLSIAKQIAEALEAAHEQGIIHRDLKPANIKVRDDGLVKVLDFGLAKLADPKTASSANATMSPTLSMQATMAGVIFGTAAYMSPEQASGKAVDKRADIWSFGVVLWEMLTGTRLFDGETISHTLADVLRADIDFDKLPRGTPPAIRDLLRRCLDRDAKRRLRDIGEARITIEKARSGGPQEAGETLVSRSTSWWRRAMPALVAAILAGTLVGIAVWNARPSAPPPTVTRFPLALPEGQRFVDNGPAVLANNAQVLAISPDAAQIVYVANRRLYLRSLSELEARPLTGTEVTQGTLSYPVFSPDGQSIAFWSGTSSLTGTVKRIAVTGGVAVTICPADFPRGMSWGDEGIVFGQVDGIKRVSANGGQPELLLSLKDGALLWGPQMLPGGDAVLSTLLATNTVRNPSADVWEKAQVVVQSLRSGERKTLIEGSAGRYLPTGHLVFARGGTLFAVPFDPRRLELAGGPVPMVEGVKRALGSGAVYFSVSDTGSLIYIPGPLSTSSGQSTLVLVDRNGRVEPLKLRPGPYGFPRVSPDGKRIAVDTDDGKDANVWIYELSGASSMRQLTFGGKNRFPVWSADGQRIAFQSDREGDPGIFWQRADGTGTAERLTKPDQGTAHVPESWSPDGSRFLFSVINGANLSLWTFTLQDRKAAAFGDVQSTYFIAATFSPDGRWVAYNTGTGSSADTTMFVQPFPATGAKYRISNGGVYPLWSPDGRELFSRRSQPGLQVVRVTLRPSFELSNPESVPAGAGLPYIPVPVLERQYDITPDGQRFIGVVAAGETPGGTAGASQIQVVLHWLEELKARVPSK